MSRLIDFTRDLSLVVFSMFVIVGLGGLMRGFMSAGGAFFEIAAISSWICATSGLWLIFVDSPAVRASCRNAALTSGFAIAVGISVQQNIAFLIWYFQGYLVDTLPDYDMSHHFIQGPLTIIALIWSWYTLRGVVFSPAATAGEVLS